MLFKKREKFFLSSATLRDGRVLGLFESGLLEGEVFVPLLEADLKRERETLESLKRCRGVKIKEIRELDKNLIESARKKRGKVVIVNENLKETQADVTIIALDDLYEKLKPTWYAGTEVRVRVLKKGKEPNEGVGYLRDGTKVVIEKGSEFLGLEIEIIIEGMIDTPAGRLVFARPKYKRVG